jgi:hypothetical protein
MLPLPVHYHPDLTHDRLEIVASALLDEFLKTVDDLSSDADDNYTRGCASFGRQKNRIKQLALAGTYPWLQLMNSTNDLVFKIGGVPCRFSSDDPNSPKKDAILTFNHYQASFFDEIESDDKPCRYCFIVDTKSIDDMEPSVVFVGFDATGNAKCQWESGAIRTFQTVGSPSTPKAVEITKPSVKPKQSSAEELRKTE